MESLLLLKLAIRHELRKVQWLNPAVAHVLSVADRQLEACPSPPMEILKRLDRWMVPNLDLLCAWHTADQQLRELGELSGRWLLNVPDNLRRAYEDARVTLYANRHLDWLLSIGSALHTRIAGAVVAQCIHQGLAKRSGATQPEVIYKLLENWLAIVFDPAINMHTVLYFHGPNGSWMMLNGAIRQINDQIQRCSGPLYDVVVSSPSRCC